MKKTTEKSLHRGVCDYIRLQYPKVLFNSDMSGIRLTMGQAVQAKNLRSNQGFPDIVIYEARHDWHGLFVELKREGERLYKKDGSPATEHIAEQDECMSKLNAKGYATCFAVGFNQAKSVIDNYLND